MKRVLVTGASGFVGRHCLAPLAARDYEVHAVFSKETTGFPALPGVSWHRTDLLDRTQVSLLLEQVCPTHLLHCAWYTVPGKYRNAPENILWVEASLHLLRTFTEVGGQRVVGVGTYAEYDWSSGYCPEDKTPLNPTTTYGVCKHALQLILGALGEASGLSAAWGRLFLLYGPHEQVERLVASVIRSILLEKPARCSHGQQIRDFLYVQDAADALVALLDSNVLGPVNIASGVPAAVSEVVREIADQLERPHLVRLDALPASENEPLERVADVARLRDELGWSPHYDLRGGLAETIKWWKLQQQGAARAMAS